MIETYQNRDKILIELGFANYQLYLESELWEVIRKVVFQRDNYRCTIKGCKHKRDRIEAHHVSYARAVLLGINPGAIVTLCYTHHKRVEFSGAGKKLTLERVQKKTVKYYRVADNRKPKSVADWIRYRFKTQRHIARRLLLLLRPTTYYSKVTRELNSGRIPKEFYDYLGLEG